MNTETFPYHCLITESKVRMAVFTAKQCHNDELILMGKYEVDKITDQAGFELMTLRTTLDAPPFMPSPK